MSEVRSQAERDRLGELFERALAFPPEEHVAFLDETCGAEPELRAELASLLAAHTAAPNFLERLGEHPLPAMLDALADETPLVGRVIGRYEVLERLGGGGMGVVYKARDVALDRPVALKFLPFHLSADESAQERLKREARAASALDHPHIAVIHEIGTTDPAPGDPRGGRLFIAMAYYEGETLEQKIARGRLSVPEACAYAIQIADGLSRAHDVGIVHRDIKPANVMVTDRGQIKIVDFGVAKGTGASLTTEGVRLGTVGYMSPEQTRGDPVDHRTDLWSLGVVLYEMLTGARPFRGEAEDAVVFGIRNDRPPLIAALAPDAPSELARVVERCMAKDPAQRYASAGEVCAALETAVAGRGLAGVETAGPEAAGLEPAVSTRRALSRRARWLAVSGIALIVLLSAGLWVVRWAAEDPPRAVAFRLLSTVAGEPGAATFSPDGDMVAFVDLSEDVPEVWVKDLAGGDPVRITSGDAPAMRPRWSGAGDRIVFARRDQGIWTVPPLGGPERRLVAEGTDPDLSADGETMVFERRDEIWISGADGSGARRVEGIPRRSTSVGLTPALSPDGRWVAFFVSEFGPLGNLWIIPSEDGVARRLTDNLEVGPVFPTWMPDGRSIVYSSARGGSRTLWGISPNGGEPFPVTSGVGGDSEPALSRDGTSMIYTNMRRRWSLRVLEPLTGDERSILEGRNGILWPMVSPDGDRVAFFGRDAAADIHVFTIELASGEVRPITHGRGEVNSMPQWSGNSERLYYYHYGRSGRSFRRIPLDGGPSVEVGPWNWETTCCAAVHPLEQVVAYVYRPPGEPPVARVRDLATSREADLPRQLRGFSWSADGRYLVGNSNDRIYRCRFESLNDCEELTSGWRPQLPGDGSRLYFFRGPVGSVEVWVRELASGEERLIRAVGPFSAADTHFHVTPRHELVWAPIDEGGQELWLAELR